MLILSVWLSRVCSAVCFLFVCWLFLCLFLCHCWLVATACLWVSPELSYMHFYRCYKRRWSNILRFLPPTTHGQRDDCQDFKERFRTTTAPGFCFNIWLYFADTDMYADDFECSSVCLCFKLKLPDTVWLISEDKQEQFDLCRQYKDHIDQIKMDRELEQYLQALCINSFILGWYAIFFCFEHCNIFIEPCYCQAQTPLETKGAPLTFHMASRYKVERIKTKIIMQLFQCILS